MLTPYCVRQLVKDNIDRTHMYSIAHNRIELISGSDEFALQFR